METQELEIDDVTYRAESSKHETKVYEYKGGAFVFVYSLQHKAKPCIKTVKRLIQSVVDSIIYS